MAVTARKYLANPSGLLVARAAVGGIFVGDLVRITDISADVPLATPSPATVVGNVDVRLAYVAEWADTTATGAGDVFTLVLFGAITDVPYVGGPPVAGDPVYVSDAQVLALTAGTVSRVVGYVLADLGGGLMSVFFDGATPKNAANIAPADAPYLTAGTSAGLSAEIDVQALAAALRFVRIDASVATVLGVATLARETSGVAANGIGARLQLGAPSDAGVLRNAATVDGVLVDVTDTAEESKLVFGLLRAGAQGDVLRLDAAGLALLAPVDLAVAKEGAGNLAVGAGVGNVRLRSGGVDYWEVDATTGALTAVIASLLSNLLPPVAGTDAATKDYVDDRAVYGRGHCYISTPAATTIAAQSTGGVGGNNYVKAAGTTTSAALAGMTMPADNRLTYTGADAVMARVSVAAAVAPAGNNQTIGIKIAINGAPVDRTYMAVLVAQAGDAHGICIETCLDLVQNDYVEVWIANESSATNATVTAMHLTVLLVPA